MDWITGLDCVNLIENQVCSIAINVAINSSQSIKLNQNNLFYRFNSFAGKARVRGKFTRFVVVVVTFA